MTSKAFDTNSYFETLIKLSEQDLSQAHTFQHATIAMLGAQVGQINTQGLGAFSSEKKLDTTKITNNKLQGSKFWVSNIPNVTWMICHVKDKVVYVELDSSTRYEIVPVMGMENTLTAHVFFDHTPCEIICDVEDLQYFCTRRTTSLSFIPVHLGLCKSLFQDLSDFPVQDLGYDKNKLKLQLEVLQLLWDQIPKDISLTHRETYYWQQKNTVYAFAKKCLTEICQFVIETNPSTLYQTENHRNQRFRDSLIYCSHMKNLYKCITH